MQQRNYDRIYLYLVERSGNGPDDWDDDHSTIGICE